MVEALRRVEAVEMGAVNRSQKGTRVCGTDFEAEILVVNSGPGPWLG